MICIGNSHRAALVEAMGEQNQPFTVFHSGHIYSEDAGGRFVLLPEIVEAIEQGGGRVLSMVAGNAHNVLGLIRHRRPFDFIHPEYQHLPLDPRAEVLPYGVMEAALRGRTKRWMDVLVMLLDAYGDRVIHLESPPPIKDQDYIIANIKQEMIAAGKRNFRVSSPALRYKLWRLNSDIYRDLCQRYGARFIPAPAKSMDEDGFLKPEYWANPTHANGTYGALLLQQLEAFARVEPVS